jgi:predicted ATP-grasp superfamily ATP-dependent carboligase
VWQFGADFATKHIMVGMNIDERLESLARSVEGLKQQSADTDRRLEAGFQKTQQQMDAGYAKTQRQIDALLAVQAEHDSRLATVTRNVDKMVEIWQETAQAVARLAFNVQDHKQRLDRIDDRLGNL